MTSIEHPEPGELVKVGGWFYAGPTLSRWQRLCLWLAGIEKEVLPSPAMRFAAHLAAAEARANRD